MHFIYVSNLKKDIVTIKVSIILVMSKTYRDLM